MFDFGHIVLALFKDLMVHSQNYHLLFYFQAALARMSNMFMGTLTIKGPKTSTAMGMSLEEMDRPVRMMIMMITGMKMVIIMHESLLLIIASNFAKHFVFGNSCLIYAEEE